MPTANDDDWNGSDSHRKTFDAVRRKVPSDRGMPTARDFSAKNPTPAVTVNQLKAGVTFQVSSTTAALTNTNVVATYSCSERVSVTCRTENGASYPEALFSAQ